MFFFLLMSALFLTSCNKNEETSEDLLHLIAIENKAEWWQNRHQAIINTDKSNIDILFLGDSITQRWEDEGLDIWLQNFGENQALNMGFSGDKVQHLLWRISNGELENISPKITFLLIGTNNSQEKTAIQIADGINKNIKQIIQKLPETKLIVFKIFPRGPENSLLREVTNQASEIVAKAVDNKKVFYIDINEHFLDINSNIPIDVMHDGLHLTSHGYEIWANTISHLLQEAEL
jgi:lysophospholipase L1-like esterase